MATDDWTDFLTQAATQAQGASQLQPRQAGSAGQATASSGAGAKGSSPGVSPGSTPPGGSPGASPAPPASQPGVLARIGRAFNPFNNDADSAAALKDISGVEAGAGAAVLRAPGQLIGGTLDTLADAGKFIDNNIHSDFARGAIKAVAQAATGLPIQAAQDLRTANRGASLADSMSFKSTLGQVGNKAVNQFVAEALPALATTVVAPEAELGGIAAKAASKMAGAGLGAALSGSTDDSHDAGSNLSGRLQQGVIAAGSEGALSAVGKAYGQLFKAGTQATKITAGTARDAAQDALDRAFATDRTSEARYQAVDPKAEPPEQEVVPPGRHTDAPVEPATPGEPNPRPTGEDQEAGGAGPEVTDANAALDKSGAAERLPTDGTHEVTPDGKFVVAPETKAALEDSPYSRAFAADNEANAKDPVIFKEEAEDGSSRVVGQMDKYDLQGFVNDAEHFRDHPEELNTDAQSRVGQWKLAPLGTTSDVAAMGRALAEQVPEKATLSDADLATQAQAIMKETGIGVQDQLRLAVSMSQDASNLAPGMVAMRTMQANINDTLTGLYGKSFASMGLDDPEISDALTAVHNAVTFANHLRSLKSTVAQALRAAGIDLNSLAAKKLELAPGDELDPLSLPDHDTYQQKFGKTPPEDLQPYPPGSAPPLPRTPQELEDWLKLHEVAKNAGPDALNKFYQGLNISPKAWMYLRSSLANFFTAAIVSAPATFMRDLAGPATVGALRTVERTAGGYAAALGEQLLGDASKVPDLLSAANQAPQAYLRTMGDVLDSFKFAVQAYKQGHSILGGPNPLDFNTAGVPQALIDAASSQGQPALPYLLGNLINKFPQAVHALHGGVNEMALRLSYLGDVRAEAMLEAKQFGYEGVDFDQWVKEALLRSTDPITGQATNMDALSQAQRTTFTKPVGDASTQPVVNSFNSFIQNVRTNFPESRYVLPIFTVPANAIGETLRRVPILGQLFKETQMELSSGGIKQAEAYGRFLTGASAVLGGLQLARTGQLTGSGPQEPNARRLWEADGMQPYSIKLGDHWVSYSRLDVVGPMLGIMGGLADHTVNVAQDSPNHVYAAVGALAQYFKDQSALQGLSDLMSFGGSPTESQSYLRQLANGTARGFVPNFITQLARNNLDPIARVQRNPWEAIMNALPGTSTLLDPQRNLMGDDVRKSAPVGSLLPLTITNVNTYAKDPVMDELDRLYTKTGYAPGVLPPAIPGGHFDARDIKLEDGHSLYDALMRARQTSTVDGQTLRDTLKDTITSDDYLNNGIDQAGRSQKPLDDEDGKVSRGAMVSKVFDDFNKQTKQDVAQASPIAARYLAVAKAKSLDSGVLASHTATELASPQGTGLMKSLGINISDYEDKVRGQ